MIPLAVQLYSLRDAGPLSDQLALVQQAGVSLVELTSANFDDPEATVTALGAHHLKAAAGHVGLGLLNETERLIDAAHILGLSDIVLWGFDEEDLGPDEAMWVTRGQQLAACATRLADAGLRLSFHNHDWELRELPGGLALDVLFRAAGPQLGWQADLAWLARGGADVPGLLARHGGRLRSVHLKDLAPAGTAREEGWADLGHGTLPWADWMPRIAALAPAWVVLEHDAPNDPVRFLFRSAATARHLLAGVAA